MAYKVVTDYTANISDNAHVKVYVRARPVQDPSSNYTVSEENPKTITVNDPTNKAYGEHSFSFDQVFW